MASENEPKSSAPSVLSQKLRTFCESKGSVRNVAEVLQITPQQLQKYVRGAQKPGADILAGLQRQGCNIDWLLDDEKPLGSFPKLQSPLSNAASGTDLPPSTPVDFEAAEFVLGRSLERAAPQFGATAEEVKSWRSGVEPPLDKLVRLTNLILFVATDGRLSIKVPPGFSTPSPAAVETRQLTGT